MSELQPVHNGETSPLPVSPQPLHQQQWYWLQATAQNTRRSYQSAIRQYEKQGGKLPAIEQDILYYLSQNAKRLNPRSLNLHLTALSHWHSYQQLPDPTQGIRVRKLLVGIHRTHGRPQKKAAALLPEHIRQISQSLENQSTGSTLTSPLTEIRNKALILTAYLGALRRSELAQLKFEDLEFQGEGLILNIRRSKTDQQGQGIVKAIVRNHNSLCAVTALETWLKAGKINSGYVFRSINRWGQIKPNALSMDGINLLIKSISKKAKIPFSDRISSHSLRRGFATSAARAGADFSEIKRQGGWRNDQTVHGYIEEAGLFDKNPTKNLLDTK
jgi:integrase